MLASDLGFRVPAEDHPINWWSGASSVSGNRPWRLSRPAAFFLARAQDLRAPLPLDSYQALSLTQASRGRRSLPTCRISRAETPRKNGTRATARAPTSRFACFPVNLVERTRWAFWAERSAGSGERAANVVNSLLPHHRISRKRQAPPRLRRRQTSPNSSPGRYCGHLRLSAPSAG